MVSIFEFKNYRDYLSKWIEAQGERSYGLKGRVAQKLGVSSSLISQILKGEKTLTPDQASELADYIGLVELEADYLHLLVDYDRAATPAFREKLARKMRALQTQSRRTSRRLPRHQSLGDEQAAIYYSSWLYTGVRNLAAVEPLASISQIADHLGLEHAVIARVVRFLLDHGLCKEEGGRLTFGPATVFVDRDSPFVNKHHQNWRFQAIQHMESRNEEDIFFTSPMSLSNEAFLTVRNLLPGIIGDLMKLTGPSDSETVACLNIDWFKY